MHRTSHMRRIMKPGPHFSEYIFCLSLNLLIAYGEGKIVHRANKLLGDYVKHRAPCSSHDIKELCVAIITYQIGEIPLNVTGSWGRAEPRGHCINPQQFHVPTAQRASFCIPAGSVHILKSSNAKPQQSAGPTTEIWCLWIRTSRRYAKHHRPISSLSVRARRLPEMLWHLSKNDTSQVKFNFRRSQIEKSFSYVIPMHGTHLPG